MTFQTTQLDNQGFPKVETSDIFNVPSLWDELKNARNYFKNNK